MSIQIKSSRDLSFDIARAISALWVVGVWHLFCYDRTLNYMNWTTQQITDVFLAVFMFISGYMLGKYRFGGWSEVKAFYKKRFWRFYILYVVASVTLYIGGALIGNQMYASTEQFVLSFLGLNVLFPPHLGTLWFISMIMFFYLITPLLSYQWEYRKVDYIVAFAFYLFFFVWRQVTGYVEIYVFLMFPMYALGLLLPKDITVKAKESPFVVFTGLIVCVILIPIVKSLENYSLIALILKILCLWGGGIICSWIIGMVLSKEIWQEIVSMGSILLPLRILISSTCIFVVTQINGIVERKHQCWCTMGGVSSCCNG